MERTTQETVEQWIFGEVHNKRYTLAGEARICNGDLFRDFGYLTNTPASQGVLDGTYKMLTDSNKATAELIAEITAIRALIPKDSVSITITPGQWKQYWQVVNKETLLRVWAAFWPLQGRRKVQHYSPLPRNTSDSYPGACNSVGKVAARSICNARKDTWGDIGVEIESNTADGGRLQRNKQDSMWQQNDDKRLQVQPNARGDFH